MLWDLCVCMCALCFLVTSQSSSTVEDKSSLKWISFTWFLFGCDSCFIQDVLALLTLVCPCKDVMWKNKSCIMHGQHELVDSESENFFQGLDTNPRHSASVSQTDFWNSDVLWWPELVGLWKQVPISSVIAFSETSYHTFYEWALHHFGCWVRAHSRWQISLENRREQWNWWPGLGLQKHCL